MCSLCVIKYYLGSFCVILLHKGTSTSGECVIGTVFKVGWTNNRSVHWNFDYSRRLRRVVRKHPQVEMWRNQNDNYNCHTNIMYQRRICFIFRTATLMKEMRSSLLSRLLILMSRVKTDLVRLFCTTKIFKYFSMIWNFSVVKMCGGVVRYIPLRLVHPCINFKFL